MKVLKRLALLLAATGLLVGGTLAGASASAAAPLLVSDLNGRCADIFAFHQENGATTVTWDCHGGTNQQWYWDGEQIRSAMNGKCLEIYGAYQGDLGAVSMWDCNGGTHQRWFRNGGEIRNRINGKCLDIHAGSSANGQLLVMWGCNGSRSQSWDF